MAKEFQKFSHSMHTFCNTSLTVPYGKPIHATTKLKQIAWSPRYVMEYQEVVTLRGSLYLHLTNAPFKWRKLFPGRRVTRTPELP